MPPHARHSGATQTSMGADLHALGGAADRARVGEHREDVRLRVLGVVELDASQEDLQGSQEAEV